MQKIIYFTSCQDSKSFKSNLKNYGITPNLSNQNFHNKLVRSFGLTHNVDVISIRPINKSYKFNSLEASEYQENNINWHYIKCVKSRVDKYVLLDTRISKIMKRIVSKDSVIVTDTMNLYILKEALKYSRKYNIKTIGVCTDNPYNISFVKENYKKSLIANTKRLSSYICLTNDINNLFNIDKKYIVIDGVTENVTSLPASIIKDNYIYFGGSLMKEYGVNEVIEAFNTLKIKDLKLVLAGHHEPSNFKELVAKNTNIIYMGSVDYETNITLEHYALCCVNPRPINDSIDRFSFPSKVLEYLSSGSITVSTMNPILMKHYLDNIIWSKSEKANDLSDAIKKALSFRHEDKVSFIEKAKREVLSRTSLSNVNILIDNNLF